MLYCSKKPNEMESIIAFISIIFATRIGLTESHYHHHKTLGRHHDDGGRRQHHPRIYDSEIHPRISRQYKTRDYSYTEYVANAQLRGVSTESSNRESSIAISSRNNEYTSTVTEISGRKMDDASMTLLFIVLVILSVFVICNLYIRSLPKDLDNEESSSSSRIKRVLLATFAGMSLSFGMLVIGLWIPLFLLHEASMDIYRVASWSYDESRSIFDNTPWSYAPGYALAVILAVLTFFILKLSRRGVSDRLSKRSTFLLSLYMISVTSGGIAHQTYSTVESRNTIGFRVLWTVCVGSVALTNTPKGLCGTELVRKFKSEERLRSPAFDNIPLIPEYFWWVYGVCITVYIISGGMSFQRPACDISIVATTQALPTLYMMTVLYFLEKVEFRNRILGMIGLVWNAPLVPIYSLLVYNTNWSLGAINFLVHSWICFAWLLQGYSLRHLVKWLGAEDDQNKRPV